MAEKEDNPGSNQDNTINKDIPPSGSIVIIKDLTKTFRKKRVLDNINFTVNAGEIFGIIGMSGVGKTTLLELMIGFLRPDSGDVLFRPEHLLVPQKDKVIYKSVFKEQKPVRQIFGFATQTPSFYNDLTVEENLKYFGCLYNLPGDIIKTNIETSLDLVGLKDERKEVASNLSGGMQKRLDIACAMIHDPDILILDEPTADLDIILRRQMWALIKKINGKGTTVIISSHFLEELEELCNRVVILHDKKIVASGTVDEVRQRYSEDKEVHLKIASGNYEYLINKLPTKKFKISRIVQEEDKIIIYSPMSEEVLHYVLEVLEKKKEDIINIYLAKASLSEVFESIVK